MPDYEGQNYKLCITNFAKDSIVANAVPPILAELFAFERMAERSRIARLRQPDAQKLQNPPRDLRI